MFSASLAVNVFKYENACVGPANVQHKQSHVVTGKAFCPDFVISVYTELCGLDSKEAVAFYLEWTGVSYEPENLGAHG